MNHIKKLAIALLGRKREYAIKGLGEFFIPKFCDWWPNERCGCVVYITVAIIFG